jgi:hypothetical protein
VRSVIWSRRALLLGMIVASLACSGCGSPQSLGLLPGGASATGTCRLGLQALGETPPRAARDSASASRCTDIARHCQWTIANARSPDRSHSTPGSYTRKPPGSCPTDQLLPVLALALRLQHPYAPHSDICSVLAQSAHVSPEFESKYFPGNCTAAAIYQAADGNVSAARRLEQRLRGVELVSFAPGPPHWFGYITLGLSDARAPALPPINIQIIRSDSRGWLISQIGYVF